MPRYMQTASEANAVALKLIELVPESDRPKAAEMIARLVNYGIRCCPRACQSTVRFNAVREAVKGLPVKVGMIQKTDEVTRKTYNALITEPIGGKPSEEGYADE